MTTHPKQSFITPAILSFMATMVLANIAGRMYRPLMPLYLQELGADISQVGLFFTVTAIAPLILQIVGGWLSDSIGRLQAIAVGSIGGVIAHLIFIVTPSWEWLILASVFSATASAFVSPSFQAFIAEQSTEESRGRAFGVTDTMFRVVGVIGPPLGGYLAQGLSFKAMFVVAGALYAAAAAIRIVMARSAARQETQPRARPRLSGLKNSLAEMIGLLVAGGVVTWIFVSDGIQDIASGMADDLLPLYMGNVHGLTFVQIGWLNGITAVVTMAVLSPAGWLSDKMGERVGIVLGFIVHVVGWVGFIFAHDFWTFAAAWVVFGAGSALIRPAYRSLISKAIPNRLRGTAYGFFDSSLGLISLPTPWVGAQLWEHFGSRVPLVMPVLGLVCAIPIAWTKFRLPAQTPENQQAALCETR